MSLVTCHIKICYNTNSHRIAALVYQVRRPIRVSKTCLMLFDSRICYWYFHETAISKNFKILNLILFRFSITMNGINMVITWYIYIYIYPLINFNIFPFKFNDYWKIYLHKYALKLLLLSNYLFRISALYVWRFFSFSILTTLHRFSSKLKTNKAQTHNHAYLPFRCPFW